MTTTARRAFTLPDAWRQFWMYPSPWIIGATLIGAFAARVEIGGWQITDAIVPVVMIAVFPFAEWVIHVCILHWRPRRVGGFTVDPLLARKHRAHHGDPRDVPLIFIPWQSLLWVALTVVAIALLAFPRLGMGLTFLAFLGVLVIGYEWMHYLIHSDYKPKTSVYRAVWRHHRLHHFKNEHYWFTVTTSGTADRILRTCPDPASVPTSPTAKSLHADRLWA
jgi:Fatty acid hydroxylase superfamily